MKLTDFVLDASSGVYVNTGSRASIGYLDGAEAYLMDVLKKTDDLSVSSPALQCRIKDWASSYHLSRYRSTILDCFDFSNKEASVLELGAGCGGVTRWLGEHFNDICAIEGSFQRASVVKLRCRDLPAVKVYCANLFDVDLENQFDVATLIGVLEYSHLFHPDKKTTPFQATLAVLSLVYTALKKDGILLLAIENKLGLKYFSGAGEDHSGKMCYGIQGYPGRNSAVTFSALEIEQAFKRAGFSSVEVFLPFPDYKMATTIVNDQVPPSEYYLYNWIDTPFPDRTRRQRVQLFNESLVLREVCKAGLLKELANSFLVIACKGDKETIYKRLGLSDQWIVRHYALHRHPVFCKRVSLVRTISDEVGIETRAAFSANTEGAYPDRIFKHLQPHERFYAGELLVFSVFEMLVLDDFEPRFERLLDQWNGFLLENFFVGKYDEMGVPLLSGEALDVTMFNIIVEKETGTWRSFDQEWSIEGLLPVDFILWRSLYCLTSRYHVYFTKRLAGRDINDFSLGSVRRLYPNFTTERYRKARQLHQALSDFAGCWYENMSSETGVRKLIKYFVGWS